MKRNKALSFNHVPHIIVIVIVIVIVFLVILFWVNISYSNEVEQYLSSLNSSDINIRIKAATELAKSHNINGVKAALKDPDKKVRHAVILHLSIAPVKKHERSDPEVVAIFIEGLKDIDSDVRGISLGQLRSYSIAEYFQYAYMAPDICQHIAELLNDPTENIRWQAILMLENCNLENIEKEMLKIANNKKKSLKTREIAIRNLGKSKIKDIDDELIKFLENNSEDKEIKRAAIDSLGKLKSLKAVDKIIPYVYDKNQQVHYSAARALGEIGDPKAVDALSDVLMYENGKVDSSALESLTKINSPKIFPIITKVIPHINNSNAKIQLANALGNIDNNEGAIVPLLELLKDTDTSVQTAAAKNLLVYISPIASKAVIEAVQGNPTNLSLSYLADKAKYNLNFPEEAVKEKQKQKEKNLIQRKEQEINKIYNTGSRLFREKKDKDALPYFYEAVDKFEKLYSAYPDHFQSSFNQIQSIRSILAGYYRWNEKNIEKSIDEYKKLIATYDKYGANKGMVIPYWFVLGEIYEKDVKDYKMAIEYYSTIATLIPASKSNSEEAVFLNGYFTWINFLIERINVTHLKTQESFSHRTLKYPNLEYSFLFSPLAMHLLGLFTESFTDKDFLNNSDEYIIEAFNEQYSKYPGTYKMLFSGISLFQNALKNDMPAKAELILERLKKSYYDDLLILIMQLDLSYYYKNTNKQKYKGNLTKALNMAQLLNIDIVLVPDSKFSSPEKTWNLLIKLLKKGDIDATIECLSPTSRHKYKEIFRALQDRFSKITSTMTTIKKITGNNETAKYTIKKIENGKKITYYIYFVNILGEWKIEQF